MNNRVKEIREENGLTQDALARKSGVARTIISQLENDSRRSVTSETMLKLSNALGKSVNDIFLL